MHATIFKLVAMPKHSSKITGLGLTYDDILLVPSYSEVLPREVNIQSKFSRNIPLNVPIVSAAMESNQMKKLKLFIIEINCHNCTK